MKKVLKLSICGLVAVMMIAGCAKKADTAETTETAPKDGVIKLGEYKGITYTPASLEVTDEQVEAEMQSMVAAHPIITEVERAAKEGDMVNVDYVGMKDGVAFEGGTASGYDLTLGSGQFIDGFEDGLIGAVKGQELSLNLTFPANYQSEELAGKPVVFDVTVNAVKESKAAELNDAFVVENTDYDTVAAYRDATKLALAEKAKEDAEYQKKSTLLQKVMEGSEVTITDASLEAFYKEQMAAYEEQAQAFGMDLEGMAGVYGMPLDDFKAQIKAMSGEIMKQNAVLKAIAEAENITVTEEDIDNLVTEFGYADKAAMLEQAGEETVNNYILTEKVVTFIADNAVEA